MSLPDCHDRARPHPIREAPPPPPTSSASAPLPPHILHPSLKGGLFPFKTARAHVEFIKPDGRRTVRLIWKRGVIYMGIFESWRSARGKVANWRWAAGSAGSPGTALPSRFATTFSHAVSISSQVERQEICFKGPQIVSELQQDL